MIEHYGWSERLQQDFAPHAARGLAPGRIVVQQRGLWLAATDHGELEARLAGRFLRDAGEGGHPVVGDWVALSPRAEEGAATIHALLPRRTAFTRKAADTLQAPQVVAANIDVAFVTASMNADLNRRRLERYLAATWQSGARPVVVLTKADLVHDPEALAAEIAALAVGAPVLAVCAVTGEGMAALAEEIRAGETCVLVGSSGAGKSTLVNALLGEARMAVGAIREDDARGRHTTTHRELTCLPGGGLIIDTPGMRELGLVDAEEGVGAAFEDVEALAARCRFHDCSHAGEPGCAVRAALEAGELDPGRWRNFQKLRRELAHQDRKEDRLAREAERRRWIAISKAQKANRKPRAWD